MLGTPLGFAEVTTDKYMPSPGSHRAGSLPKGGNISARAYDQLGGNCAIKNDTTARQKVKCLWTGTRAVFLGQAREAASPDGF